MTADPLLPPSTIEFLDMVERFAKERLGPHYREHDRTASLRPEVLKAVGAMGLLGLRAPEELGGQGADAVTTGLVAEIIGRNDVSVGYLVNNAALVTEVLLNSATDAQKAEFVPSIASGEVVPAVLLTEPDYGSDAAALRFSAKRDGRGWVLEGEKTSITFGMQAQKGLLFARTSEKGAKGITAFYVDLDVPNIARTPFNDLGGRAIGRATLHFDAVTIGEDRVIGNVDGGFTQVMRGFEFARALIALICLGAAQASLDDAMQQARDRVAFGQPIGKNQGVAFPLVEHATFIAAARLLSLRALQLKDAGLSHAVESNMVKWWAPRLSAEVAHDALLIFGQAGYSDDYPLGQRMRDIIGLEIGDGTAQIAKLVVARQLLGRENAP